MPTEADVALIKDLDRQIAKSERTTAQLRTRRYLARLRLREQGWSYRRIAALSNCTDSAVEKDVNRAR